MKHKRTLKLIENIKKEFKIKNKIEDMLITLAITHNLQKKRNKK